MSARNHKIGAEGEQRQGVVLCAASQVIGGRRPQPPMKEKDQDARVDDSQYAGPLATAAGHEPLSDDDYPYDDEDPDDDDDFDCHRGPDGSCGLAGTEECDWECPYSRR